MNNIRNDLMTYHYTTVYQEYYNTIGYSSTTQQISDRINSGVSIVNYCNHGNQTAWQSHSPWYSNSHVNALTNDNMLPIIWSVACLNGQYDYSQPCFAETWLRATNNSTGAPTGAIGGMFSYISQPWVPPMYGQDEMVDVLIEIHSDNIKRTLGGCSFDGNMKILDQYGQGGGQGLGTYMAWILYGDPTLTLRNAIPTNMGVTHAPSMTTSATNFTVNATNGNGALATLTRNNEIMGSATINNGTCNITFTAPGTPGTATLTVFGYNKITYIATIQIIDGGTQSYTVNVSANPANGGHVEGGGTYMQGQSCTVTASANEGYIFRNWTENGNLVSSQASYTFTVNGNRNLVANFEQEIQTYNIRVSANPMLAGTVTGGGPYQQGESCTVTATAHNGYNFVYWTENGNIVSTESSYTFTVNANRVLIANFQPQSFHISVFANPENAGTVTGGGTYSFGSQCTVTATPIQRYDFVNWTENGNVVSTEASYTFTVNASRDLVANFEMPLIEIRATVDPLEAANVTGTGTYEYGATVTLTLVRNEDWAFMNWTEEDEVVSDEMTYTFIATESRNLVAHFMYTESIGENNIATKVYPNPTQGEIILEGEELNHVRVVNANGQTVYDAKVEGETVRIDLTHLTKGIYMMHIEAEGGQAVRKIVVE